ncbi:MAG: M3 family oligoendopeptidase [Spirochaetia bacterium]|nr:M3 family oligoendopeptidase [Spirochaetia bacterium]
MNDLPRWDLASIYTDIDSNEFRNDMKSIVAHSEDIANLLDNRDKKTLFVDLLIQIITSYEVMLDTFETLNAFTQALLTVDTTDKKAMQGVHDVSEIGLLVHSNHVKFVSFLADNKDEVYASIKDHPYLNQYHYVLTELINEKLHMMSFAEEALAADLVRSGAEAFSRLHEAITSTSSIVVDQKSGEKKSANELRALAFHEEREVRKEAYYNELELWKSQETPLSYALNGVKGAAISLYTKRNYTDPLENALIQSRIDRGTLDAMICAIEDNLSVFHRYFRAKAHHLGLEVLSFYDLFAPIGSVDTTFSFSDASRIITKEFSSFHPAMGAFAKSAFANNWIDAPSVYGKVGGAYCTSFPLRKETRILCNYDGSFDAVSTVAHELGHAYHDYITKDESALLRHYPMTLAETASIFSQFIVFKGLLEKSSKNESIALIEGFIQDASQTCLDILSRFYFEREVFERRAMGELSGEEFCEIMKDSQLKTYQDALNSDELHPYMWAVKGHYYSVDLPFYNFPYAFGQLFSLGLYTEYEKHKEGFSEKFDALLNYTGKDEAAKVTLSASCDITTDKFWTESIGVIRSYVDQFCSLVGYEG